MQTSHNSRHHTVVLFSVLALLLSAALVGCSNVGNPVTADAPSIDNVAPAIDDQGIITDDFFHADRPEGLGKSTSLFGGTYKWHYRTILKPQQNGELRWCIRDHCTDGIRDSVVAGRAFALWQPFVPFTFTYTSNPAQANIVISFDNTTAFRNADGSSVNWYQGGGMYLGVAWAPNEGYANLGFDYWGDIFINDNFVTWKEGAGCTITRPSSGTTSSTTSLLNVLSHEIGHALGLDHDPLSSTLMYSTASARTTLADNDITFITQLYNLPYQIVYQQQHMDRLITQSFTTILGRAPTSTELSAYRGKLVWNRLPSKRAYDYQLLMRDLCGLPEKWNKCAKNKTTFVNTIYTNLLGRSPTTGERNTAVGYLTSGATTAQVALGVLRTSGWYQRCVQQTVYQQLGRTVTQADYDRYLASMVAGTKKPEEVIVDVVNTQEYFDRGLPRNNRGFITRAYSTLLKATPTSAALADWLTLID